METQVAKRKPTQNPYFTQQFKTASPEKLILLLYDLGIKSCKAGDRGKASRVFVELISSLNFDYREIALQFFDLYRYAQDRACHGKFDEALMVLEGLREVWASAVMGQQGINN